MLSKKTMDRPPVAQFHAHVYYDPATTRSRAERLRERVVGAFSQAKLGRWHDELVGPHPKSVFQIAFPAEIFGAGDDLTDHSTHAAWLGAPLTLRLGVFEKRK
jgi:aromatic ring-cleaving dioxygenase